MGTEVTELDFNFDGKLDKNLIMRLTNCNWLKNWYGHSCCGANWCWQRFYAPGHFHCEPGYKVLYRMTGRNLDPLKRLSKHYKPTL